MIVYKISSKKFRKKKL